MASNKAYIFELSTILNNTIKLQWDSNPQPLTS